MKFSKLFFILNLFILIVCLSLFFSRQSFAENKKSDRFSEFYEPQRVVLNYFVSTDKNKTIPIDTMVSGDDFIIITNENEKKEIHKYLVGKVGLDSDISKKIINNLASGTAHSSRFCIGFRSECGLTPEEFDFVYIPEKNSVSIHVNSKFFHDVKSGETKYIKNEPRTNALISFHSTNLFLNEFDSTYKSKINYRNESYYGLSNKGYFHSDFLLTSENESSFYELTFNKVSEDKRLTAGYRHNNSSWNNTSFLGDFGVPGFMVQLGSDESMVKDSGVDRRIYFNVNRSGRLEVIDEFGRYLISKNVNTGQHFISYSELPKGSYNINIRVYDGEQEIYKEILSVYNYSTSYSNGYDYMLTGGYYNPDWVNSKNNTINKTERDERFFFDGKLSTQLSDKVIVGGGALMTDYGYAIYSGLDIDINRTFRTSLIYNSYNLDDYSFKLHAYAKNISLSYYHSNIEEDIDELYDMININKGVRDTISLNFHHSFDSSLSYVGSLSHTSSFNYESNYYNYSYNHTTLKNSIYFSNLPLKSKLGIQYDATFDKDEHVQHGFYVNISIPLYDNLVSYTHGTYGTLDSSNKTRHLDTLSSDLFNNKYISVNSRLGASYEQNDSKENTYDLATSINYVDSNQNANGYVYMNSKSSNTLTAQYSTSTILTGNDFISTNNKSSTYFINRNSSPINDNNSFLAVVNSSKNGNRDKTYTIKDGVLAYPLEQYKDYDFSLDTDASDFYNIGESQVSGSSLPGTIIGLNTGLGEVKSIISTFSDINGDPISDVECVGYGCVSINDISQGVYQIRLKPELSYKIISRTSQCVIPSLRKAENLNFGNNFCMPSFNEDEDGLQFALDENGNHYYFLGKFNKDINEKHHIHNLTKEKGVELIVKKVDDFEFIFVKSKFEPSKKYKTNMSDIMSFALNDNVTPYASVGN